MRKVILTLLITAILAANLFAQKPIIDYQNAVIYKKSNDSIKCKIELVQVSEKELDPMGEVYINYKIDGKTEKQSMKIKEIQSIKLDYCTYLNVSVDKQELLFKVAIKGKVSLLEFPRISIILSGGIEKFGPKEIKYYAIKTNSKTVIIKQKKDLKELMDIIEPCPGAKALVDNRSFNLDNLKSLVTRLNECD